MKNELDSLVNQMIERGIHFTDAVSELEKRFIKKVLDKNKGNQSKAAKVLGIHRNTLSRKIDELELGQGPNHRKRASR